MRSERFTSQQYKTAVARANELDQELIRISEELARAATERSRLTRLQTAAPHVQILTQAQAELHSLSDAAVLPQGFERVRGNHEAPKRGRHTEACGGERA